MSATEIADTANKAAALISRDLEREVRRELELEVRAEFAVALDTEFPTPIPSLVFRRAWNDGHHAGYHEVASIYEGLADLVQAAVKEIER